MGESGIDVFDTLVVNEIYYTLQGEGRYAGWPMVVVRLHGCAVGCLFCDTTQTWAHAPADDERIVFDENIEPQQWTRMRFAEIVGEVHALSVGKGCEWVLLTGGEPLEQRVSGLIQMLGKSGSLQGFNVCIETSGTACADTVLPLSARVWLCVSPKIGMPGKRKLDDSVMRAADEWKFVIGKPDDLKHVWDCIDKYEGCGMISLQPMSASTKATQLCVDQCLENGWHLSLQQHKIVGLP